MSDRHLRAQGALLVVVSLAVTICTLAIMWDVPSGGHATLLFSLPTIVTLIAGARLVVIADAAEELVPLGLTVSAILLDVLRVAALILLIYFVPFSRGASRSLMSFCAGVSIALFLSSLTTAAMLATQQRQAVQRYLRKHGYARVARCFQWLEENSIATLLCALAAFLHITVFLSLAVAFDDNRADRRALYPTVNESPFDTLIGSQADTTRHDRKAGIIFFARGDADLDATVRAWRDQAIRACAGKNQQSYAALVRATDSRLSEAEVSIVAANVVALCEIQAWATSARDHGALVSYNGTLIGHSDDSPVIDRSRAIQQYRSNFDLASARANQLLLVITRIRNDTVLAEKIDTPIAADGSTTSVSSKGLWTNVQWQVLATASERLMLIDDASAWPVQQPGIGNSRSAEFQIEAVSLISERDVRTTWQRTRALLIVDYMYFMIYTITTTGYGDLIPISANAKAIVSIANIIEVAYLAIVFSLLFGASRGKVTTHGVTSDPASTNLEASARVI